MRSLVSALFAREAVERHGLPYAEYFFWSDDAEYTARLLEDGIGYFVDASVVGHRTAVAGLPIDRGDGDADVGPWASSERILTKCEYTRWRPRHPWRGTSGDRASGEDWLRRA